MKVFESPNLAGGWKCPICNKDDKKPVVLCGIRGTEEGGNMQAEQIHLDCIELTLYKSIQPDAPACLMMPFEYHEKEED